MSSKIWLSSPHMGGNEQKFIQSAFDTNWIAPLGPNVTAFENDLENYLGNVHVAAVSSGTAAIHLGLILLGVRAGDDVICQTMTFSASANPILYLGANPIFIDSESDTWNMCPQALEDAIKDRITRGKSPKAIISVHLYGVPYKVDEIHAVAKKYNIPVLEDSAEALGSSYKGKRCGTFGEISILSFNGNKIITTSGGGALVCRSEQMKSKAIFFATQSRDSAPHYQHSEIGYNYRLSNVCAGIGRGQMEVLARHVEARREMNQFYVDLFAEISGVEVYQVPDENYYSNYWLSAILFDDVTETAREKFRQYLDENNVECRPLWKPMHLQPVFHGAKYYGGNVAEKLFARGLCMPSGSNLTINDRNRIKVLINDYFSV